MEQETYMERSIQACLTVNSLHFGRGKKVNEENHR
jgi:hypothetical protein